MTTPETIYLIPGEYEGENCLVWCDCAAPDSYCDPDEAVKYVRADTLPQPMLPPFPPFGEGMPRYGLSWNGPASLLSTPMDDGFWTPWHLASAENERLQARVAELELEEVGAKKAFGVVADSNKDLKIRVLSLEKTIGSLMTELYGKKRNDAGSDDD
jgi:hypothetical protein